MTRTVVAGGSMAGLLTALVLGEDSDVTVVEPDDLAAAPDHRAGVPQSTQAHVLLSRGAAALEELLPGLQAELAAAGAPIHPAGMGPDSGFRMVGPDGPFAAVTSETDVIVGASRPLLERTVRRRVLAHPRIDVHSGRRLSGLEVDAGRITGARVRAGATEETLAADLVVDATGRHSRSPQMLAAAGIGPVPEVEFRPAVGYASRRYRRPTSPSAGWHGTMVLARPGENPRIGTLLPAENDTCIVNLGGMGGHYPPTDDDGFRRWARDLPDPGLHEALTEATPLSEVHAYRTPTTRLRRFERLRAPRGFFAIGDAVASFNPVYGQGMSVAALEALAVRAVLRRAPRDLATAARRAVAAVAAGPWSLAAGQDRPWTGDRRSVLDRVRDSYLRAVQSSATEDPVVAGAFAEILMMTAGPSALMRPAVLGRVATHRWHRRHDRPEMEVTR
ncbi:FAD-dependent oxidoreductase [Actinomycetospora termitidis]|uniref:FAD-dependent monooxygenase n=1 Tax=Actinomycetospora termitidis TaxID=3053470 RepID=A0ABT7M3L4_9PSEU|nr:FAD-dependent monooxygenase [Actinomycetospora sp. Odt1-22]MDL5155239.1 FAD-dependent monooxygenase [Actinomycetospora sp. Odt1-22]